MLVPASKVHSLHIVLEMGGTCSVAPLKITSSTSGWFKNSWSGMVTSLLYGSMALSGVGSSSATCFHSASVSIGKSIIMDHLPTC